MTKYDTKSHLAGVIRTFVDQTEEVFIDDATDETWASIIYRPTSDTFSIYVDMRDNGGFFSDAMSTIIVDKTKLLEALERAEELGTK